jgi:hypothetical protein
MLTPNPPPKPIDVSSTAITVLKITEYRMITGSVG